MYLTNASISALFRRIELFAALSGLFFAHNSLKINCFHHWDGLYLVCRFTCDCRKYGSWGAKFRHEMTDALMIEGSVHHLDILADMAGAKCDTIYAQTWNPKWGEYGGDSQGLVTMHMENGTRATYEGAKTNANGFNWWAQEYIRAECEGATLIMDRRQVERFP